MYFLHLLYLKVFDTYCLKFVVFLAGFGATPAASGFGTNFGLGAGGTAFGQAQCRPAASGTTPFSMCEVRFYAVNPILYILVYCWHLFPVLNLCSTGVVLINLYNIVRLSLLLWSIIAVLVSLQASSQLA